MLIVVDGGRGGGVGGGGGVVASGQYIRVVLVKSELFGVDAFRPVNNVVIVGGGKLLSAISV